MMTLVKRTPSHSFPSFSNVLEGFINDIDFKFGQDHQATTPSVNITENQEGYTLELAAPGLNKEDFHINLEQNLLSISVEKNIETKGEDTKYKRKEFNFNRFKRSFSLPEHIDGNKIEAKYEQGILRLSIPKPEEVKPKSIRID
ncbi:Hsp20/alpha crystallin family protein [Rapidithrix thailandica]|uniref:Hsp20/alpha crystallin family protein n=1 Tax=Rapidithrix thailandica TaxID=413964 RepID=A0AAW9S5V1_9BACT